MTTIQSKRLLHLFTGVAALVLSLFLSACGGGGDSGELPQAPVIGNGVVTTLAGDGTAGFFDGTGTAAQLNQPEGITSDGTNLYVADTDNHRIRKLVIATGEVTTLAGDGTPGFLDGTGTAAQFSDPNGIIYDGTNLYVADSSNQRIRQIVIATGEVSTLAGSGNAGFFDGSASAAQFFGPQGITTDGTNLYVTEFVNNRIRKIVIATGQVTTLAGDGTSGFLDGTGTAAQFYQPNGITFDGTDLYVADTLNHRIRKIVLATGEVTTLTAQFDLPAGITSNGINLYVTESSLDSRVSQIVIATGEVTPLAGGSPGFSDGTGSLAKFSLPEGITFDGTDLYVADRNNNRIRRIQTPALPTTPVALNLTGEVTTLAGDGTSGFIDGIGSAAQFDLLQDITSDGINLYVADFLNNRIRQIVIATGVVTTLAGDGTPGFLDGTGTAAQFKEPRGITFDGANLYVSDSGNKRIRQIVLATGKVTTLAGDGTLGFIDGVGTSAQFAEPIGITYNGNHLYVGDTPNNSIRQIVIATGEVTTLAGDGIADFLDGAGTAARFNSPTWLTSDGTNLYVADSENRRIRQIVIATGVVTTLAGDGTSGFLDGTGTAAQFAAPAGITFDGTNLYVADALNNSIRQIVIATGVVSTLAGGTFGFLDGTGTAAHFALPAGITTDGTYLYVADAANNSIRRIQ